MSKSHPGKENPRVRGYLRKVHSNTLKYEREQEEEDNLVKILESLQTQITNLDRKVTDLQDAFNSKNKQI